MDDVFDRGDEVAAYGTERCRQTVGCRAADDSASLRKRLLCNRAPITPPPPRHVGSGAHPRQIMAFDGDEACWQYDSVKNSPGHGVVVHRTHEFRVGPPPGGSTTVASKLRWLRVVAGRGTDLQVIMGLLKS